MICIKKQHKLCEDESILDIRTFCKAAEGKIKRDIVSRPGTLKQKLKVPFINTEIREISVSRKEETETHEQEMKSLDQKLNQYIKIGLRKMQEQVFELQKQAMKENNQLEGMSLETIDYIKKKCHIKLDRENKKLELKFKNSNKIQEYLLLNKFLKFDFDLKFKTCREKLMKFQLCSEIKQFKDFTSSPFLTTNFEESSASLSVTALKNSHWRNKKGRFNQMVLFTKPVTSCLFEIHLQNLSYKSTNAEILVLNQCSFDYWSKRIKFNQEENFQEIPCLEKVDFDLRKSHPVAKICKENREIRSLEMSIGGCRRLAERASFIVNLNQKKAELFVWDMNTELLKKSCLLSNSRAGNPQEPKMLSGLDVEVKSEIEEDDEDWEDVSTENEFQSEETQSLNKTEMKKFEENQTLYLAMVLHNEFVKAKIRFHDF